MIYLAYISVILSLVQLLVAFTNLLFRQALPSGSSACSGLVSVLIPARNEEKNIGTVLHDLQLQSCRNIEIIVFDDLSDDSTSEVVDLVAENDYRIKLIKSAGLPEGWLGKNYACHTLSKLANGEYLLFLDADVKLKKDIIEKTIAYSEKYKLGLLSIFPVQEMLTTGERITVPIMNYILLSLLPLVLVRRSTYSSLAAANGQFMLFNAVTYNELSPHEHFKDSKVEDIKIARYFKQKHIDIACITGISNIKCRMYKGFSDAVNGFSRNVITFFGDSVWAALLFWVFTTFGFVFILLTFNLAGIVAYIIIVVLTRVIISIISRQNILLNLVYLIPQQFAMGFFIYKALINKTKRQYLWKGRTIK